MRNRGALIDHAATGKDGAYSVVTVKYTTARGVAQHVVDAIARKLGRPGGLCVTATTPLPGADLESVPREVASARAAHPSLDAESAEHLVRSYGTGWREVVGHSEGVPAADALRRIVAGHPAIRAEVHHAVRREMARTLADVVVRRVRIGVAGHPGDEAARVVARLQAGALGWDEARTGRELDALRAFYLPVGS